MDVLQEIKKEHEEFKSLMKKIQKGQKKESNFQSLKNEVKAHHEAEEKVIFPDVKDKSQEEGKSTVREMIEEHHLISYQLGLLERTSMDNETWDAKFSVLKEVLTHHLDEEEKEFFSQARKVLTEKELENKYPEFEKVHKEEENK
jgi:hemerythrin superfamily protein